MGALAVIFGVLGLGWGFNAAFGDDRSGVSKTTLRATLAMSCLLIAWLLAGWS